MIAEKNVNANKRRQYAVSEGWMMKKLLLFSYPFIQHLQYHLTEWGRIKYSLTGTINVHKSLHYSRAGDGKATGISSSSVDLAARAVPSDTHMLMLIDKEYETLIMAERWKYDKKRNKCPGNKTKTKKHPLLIIGKRKIFFWVKM